MRGMYLNCDPKSLPASFAAMSDNSKLYQFPENIADGYLIYDTNAWSTPPLAVYQEQVFIASGWFIYKQKLNPLALLAKDIVERGPSVLNDILAGVFVIFWKNDEQQTLLTDPLGLSTHYIDRLANGLRIAPSVKALLTQEHTLNNDMQSILRKKQHLFGNYTLYNEIERLQPGAAITSGTEQSYFTFYDGKAIEDLGEYVNTLTEFWPYDTRILPLSSGLDSRYLLANGAYKYGFTYGPEGSPERKIAGHYQQDFEHYHAFDFNEQPLHEQEQAILDEMAFATLKPINRLYTNYHYIAQYYNQASTFYDGYLGDLFQRGTYINFKGKRGELLKLVPFVYRFINFSAHKLLRLRYKELTNGEFEILWQDFKVKTANLELNDYQKVTYYEFVYGRGGRYTVFGSNVLAAQFFTIVSPFASRIVFDSFIQQDYSRAVSYRNLKSLWSKTASKYKNQVVESGYSPQTPAIFIPFIQLAYRLMFHFIPSRANYGVKLKRMEKQNK